MAEETAYYVRKVLKLAALGEEKKCPKTLDKDEDDEGRRKAVKKGGD